MGIRRPWNIVDMPVYSLATYADGMVNMNICTYVSAVSMKPKLYMIAIDYTTKTFQNLEKGCDAVLQVLHQDHSSLIKGLGKKSGQNINKEAFLERKNMLDRWNDQAVLKGACAYVQLKQAGRKQIEGDHELFWFEVKKSKTQSESGILMFQDLIERKIIL